MKWVKQTIHYWCSDTRSNHCLGKGICAAILDTGISAHPDFSGRILDFQDFTSSTPSVSLHDDSGHGTHVAGILAGSGQVSSGLYAGIAPDADLLICKVLDHEGNGNIQTVLKGIDWILKIKDSYPLHLVNISVGSRPTLPPGQKKLLLDAVEHLWDLGLTVVVSSGNYGPLPGTVSVPGTSPKVITVGVPDTLPLFRTGHSSSNYSGRGPTDHCIKKPDVFAPGTGIISCNSRYISSMKSASVRPALFQRPPFLSSQPYIAKTGTSMATPVVTGAIACLLSKYPDLSNVEAKLRLHNSCQPIPGTESGWGLLHVANLLNS
ncbi:S8 family peptidase [uncultured Mediterraneibacter sp.]|nr:S8 family peptidase [uncultured Mediterraneibacter sp.]